MEDKEYSMSVQDSIWNYFPNDPDKKARRFKIQDGQFDVMYVDYFVNEENCYLLSIFVSPKYRNQNMPILGSRMMSEYLADNELKNVKNLVYPNMEDSVRTIYQLDKRRYSERFNIVSMDVSKKIVEEFYEGSTDV